MIKYIKIYVGLPLLGISLFAGCSHGPSQSDAPAAPSELRGQAVGTFSVQLYWSDNSDNEDRFVIYRSIGAPYEIAGEAGPDAVAYLDEIQTSCAEASYYIVAENDGGQSIHSNRITVPLLCGDDPTVELINPAR